MDALVQWYVISKVAEELNIPVTDVLLVCGGIAFALMVAMFFFIYYCFNNHR